MPEGHQQERRPETARAGPGGDDLADRLTRLQARAEQKIGRPGGPNHWCPKNLLEHVNVQRTYAPDAITARALDDLAGLLLLHRPVGSDGKHGDLHTPTCGCER